MAQDHSAFFGNNNAQARREQLDRTLKATQTDPMSLFERARAQAGAHSGVPADLIPYLEEADLNEDSADSEQELSQEQAHQRVSREEAERSEALRSLVEHSLLLGPDPSILEEIEDGWFDDAELSEGETSDDHHTNQGGVGHQAALDQAQKDSALKAEVDRIYHQIIARAPEHKVQPSLERMERAMDILGAPQNTYSTVHVTGTNGKTSTARMIDSILREMGLKVGLFTSPHLVDVRERIQIDGEPIRRDEFIHAWKDVEPYVGMVDQVSAEHGGPNMSFFEVFTTMAYAAFADHPVDAAVVEVGMGGLWDSTNVVDSAVSVIMPVALDHQKWLGNTITEIAEQKAGIIKPHQTVVVANQPPEALDVILKRAKELDAVVRLEGRDFEVLDRQMGVGGQMVTLRTPSAVYEDVFVPLLGPHQAHNAAAALVAVEAFMGGQRLDGRLVEQGFMKATSPGRLQVVRTSPTVLVDAAHNPAGAQTLADSVTDSFAFTHLVGVYAAMADKDIDSVLGIMEPQLEALVVTQMPGERAASIEELNQIARDVFGADRVDVREDLPDAIDRAVELAEASSDPLETTGIVVFGSVVLAGEALALFGAQTQQR